jgi:hypothetical protein
MELMVFVSALVLLAVTSLMFGEDSRGDIRNWW